MIADGQRIGLRKAVVDEHAAVRNAMLLPAADIVEMHIIRQGIRIDTEDLCAFQIAADPRQRIELIDFRIIGICIPQLINDLADLILRCIRLQLHTGIVIRDLCELPVDQLDIGELHREADHQQHTASRDADNRHADALQIAADIAQDQSGIERAGLLPAVGAHLVAVNLRHLTAEQIGRRPFDQSAARDPCGEDAERRCKYHAERRGQQQERARE